MSLHHLSPAPLVLFAGLALTAPVAHGQLLDLQSQTRTVAIQIDHHEQHWTCFPYTDPECLPDFIITTSYSDDDVAPDAGPWVAIASLAQFPDTFASQDSEITWNSIRASGGQSATSYYDGWEWPESPIIDIEEPHSSTTSFFATFVVATAEFYRLTGYISAASGLFAESTAFIRLTGPGAQVIAETQLQWSGDGECDPPQLPPYCWERGPVPIVASGVLPPGTYTLEAGAGGVARGYAKFSISERVSGDFDVRLRLGQPVVPALSNGGLAVLGASLLCAALWLARRRMGETSCEVVPSGNVRTVK